MLGKHLRQPRAGSIAGRDEGGPARAQSAYRAHRDDRLCQPFRDIAYQALIARPAPVDLVDEEQHRDAQSPQGTPQDARLRLDALDGRHHQDDTVQHAQRALHLGHEVRVAGRVDQVNDGAANRERDDGRLDRDPALTLQGQRIGLRRA